MEADRVAAERAFDTQAGVGVKVSLQARRNTAASEGKAMEQDGDESNSGNETEPEDRSSLDFRMTQAENQRAAVVLRNQERLAQQLWPERERQEAARAIEEAARLEQQRRRSDLPLTQQQRHSMLDQKSLAQDREADAQMASTQRAERIRTQRRLQERSGHNASSSVPASVTAAAYRDRLRTELEYEERNGATASLLRRLRSNLRLVESLTDEEAVADEEAIERPSMAEDPDEEMSDDEEDDSELQAEERRTWY